MEVLYSKRVTGREKRVDCPQTPELSQVAGACQDKALHAYGKVYVRIEGASITRAVLGMLG